LTVNSIESSASASVSPELPPAATKLPGNSRFDLSKAENVFLLLLLFADGLFILFHILSAYKLLPKNLSFGNRLIPTGKEMFSLSRDRGYPEMFQYIQFFWICIALVLASFHNRSWRYLAWVPLFIYLLLDDYGRIHETVGARLAAQYQLPSIAGLHPKHTGELIVAGIIGLALLLIYQITVYHGDWQIRRFSKVMVLLMVALAVCAVGFDAINNAVSDNVQLNIFGILEDGGEMLVVSLMCWWTFVHAILQEPRKTSIDTIYSTGEK
jgi:hypothetical protein